MKKRLLSILLVLTMVLTLLPVVALTASASVETLEIDTADKLVAYAEAVKTGSYNPNVVLTADIDLSGKTWTPIGVLSTTITDKIFNGTFDGNGYVIRNLSVDTGDWYDVGLFGSVGQDAVIKNLTVYGSVKTTGSNTYVGGIVGGLYGGTVQDCCFVGTVSATDNYCSVGGIVGYAEINANIKNCAAFGSAAGAESYWNAVGGIVGNVGTNATGVSIVNCYSANSLTGEQSDLGAIVGYIMGSLSLNNCYFTNEGRSTELIDVANYTNGTKSGSATVLIKDQLTASDVTNNTAAGWVDIYGSDGSGQYPALVDSLNKYAKDNSCRADWAIGPDGYPILKKNVVIAAEVEDTAWTGEAVDPDDFITVNSVKFNGSDVAPVPVGYSYTYFDISNPEYPPVKLSGAPTDVGYYKVMISIDAEDPYYYGSYGLGTGEDLKFVVTPVLKDEETGEPVEEEDKEDIEVESGTETGASFSSSAAFKDFIEVTMAVPGSDDRILVHTDDPATNEYDATEGSIIITLTPVFLNTLEPGEYEFSIVSGIFPNDTCERTRENALTIESDPLVYETTQTVIINAPECYYETCIKEAENAVLVINGDKNGEFKVISKNGGYQLYKEDEGFLALVDGSLKYQQDGFTWKYDGGLYHETVTKTTKFNWGWFFFGGSTTTVKTYLNAGVESPTTGTSRHGVKLGFYGEHVLECIDNCDGETHRYICKNCKQKVGENEAHEDKDICKCGHKNPAVYCVTDAEVDVKTVTSYSGFWLFRVKHTSYKYTITPKCAEGVSVKKTQYYNGEKLVTGSVITSDVALTYIRFRFTDNFGNVTEWYWDGTDVHPYAIP